MRIAVFGATGRTGNAVVLVSLRRGYHVQAHCRDAGKVSLAHQNLRVFESDFDDAKTLRNVVEGSDAIVIAFGPRPPYTEQFCAPATRQVLLAMKEMDVSRVICVTGAMVGESARRSFLFERLRQSLARRMPENFADRAAQETAILESDLDWTVVKPPRLTENKARNAYRTGEQIKVGLLSSIGRMDLAEFMIDLIERPRHVREAVAIVHAGSLSRVLRRAVPSEILEGEFHVP